MFKPFYSLLVLLSVFFVFIVLTFAPIPHKFHLGSIEIKIPKIDFSFQVKNKTINKKAEKIIKELSFIDSVSVQKSKLILKDTTTTLQEFIQYPDSTFGALRHFFNAIETSKRIHVLHYGDSQIEGDRITGYLRQLLQSALGGSGAGIIVPFKVNGIMQAIDVENKGDWYRYTLFGNQNKDILTRNYGPLLQFVRYAPFYDTLAEDSTIYNASLIFKPNTYAFISCFKFNTVQLAYGNLHKPVLVQLFDGNDFILMKTLNPTPNFHLEKFELTKQPKSLTIEFVGKDSPDIYGISFESSKGIWIDNVPMRGSAGTDIASSSLQQLAFYFKQLNVKLLIYEFGVNVIPYITENYDYYEQWVYHQLCFLKKANPAMSILVIGVSDMSMKTDSGFVSYPNIEAIRNAQRKAAFRAGCAFWDIYQAMGGQNSMPVWVKSGLAAKDYTHFSQSGAKKIAKMLYNAIYNDYQKFKKSKKLNS